MCFGHQDSHPQAADSWAIVTADEQIARYPVETIW
jgi:hypothetical protein